MLYIYIHRERDRYFHICISRRLGELRWRSPHWTDHFPPHLKEHRRTLHCLSLERALCHWICFAMRWETESRDAVKHARVHLTSKLCLLPGDKVWDLTLGIDKHISGTSFPHHGKRLRTLKYHMKYHKKYHMCLWHPMHVPTRSVTLKKVMTWWNSEAAIVQS